MALNTLIQKHFEEEGSKYGNVTVRLLVWSAQSGAIIGKSGQGITKLRTVTGADIRILARHETPICASAKDDLVCQIVASKETVSKAVAAVTDIIRAHPVENILQRRVVRSNSADVSIEIALRMLVPISKTGNIIGKGGEVIQKIRAETGSKIQLFQLSEDHEYRVVEFTSTNVPVCAAQEALLRCIYKMNELVIHLLLSKCALSPPLRSPLSCLVHRSNSPCRSLQPSTVLACWCLAKRQERFSERVVPRSSECSDRPCKAFAPG